MVIVLVILLVNISIEDLDKGQQKTVNFSLEVG